MSELGSERTGKHDERQNVSKVLDVGERQAHTICLRE
jgi:hypothetical protein